MCCWRAKGGPQEGWPYTFITHFHITQNDTDTRSGNFISLGNFKGVPDQKRDNSKYQDYGKKKNFRSILMKNSYLHTCYGLNTVPLKFCVEALNPNGAIFGDRAYKEVIEVKQSHKGLVLLYNLSL